MRTPLIAAAGLLISSTVAARANAAPEPTPIFNNGYASTVWLDWGWDGYTTVINFESSSGSFAVWEDPSNTATSVTRAWWPLYDFWYRYSDCFPTATCTPFSKTYTTHVSSSAFSEMWQAKAIDAGVADDGLTNLWVVGDDYGVYHWVSSGRWDKIPGSVATRIDVQSDGTPWIVNADHQIWHWDGAEFRQIPGGGNDVACGADGSVYVVGDDSDANGDGQIYRWTGATYGNPWTPVGDRARAIDVCPSGDLWSVKGDRSIHRRSNGVTTQIPGQATDVGCGGVLGYEATYVVGVDQIPSGYPLFQFTSAGFAQVPGAAATTVTVDRHRNPIVTNLDHEVWLTTLGYE